MLIGRIDETVGGVYRVRMDDGSKVEASIRGRLKANSAPIGWVVVGDRVELARTEEAYTIERVLERTSQLVRATARGRIPKVMAANLDRLIVVVAARRPDPREELIDRMLVLGEFGDLECVLVINKVDLEGAGDRATALRGIYEAVGYVVLMVSAETGQGMERLTATICAGSSSLIGPSGAGKSTLLNRIQPGLRIRTGQVSTRGGQGRHTTVGSRLIELECGGLVADTPGFADVRLWGVECAQLDRQFPELRALADQCQFRACTHLHEPGCAVRAGVAGGEVATTRYESYSKLYEELADA